MRSHTSKHDQTRCKCPLQRINCFISPSPPAFLAASLQHISHIVCHIIHNCQSFSHRLLFVNTLSLTRFSLVSLILSSLATSQQLRQLHCNETSTSPLNFLTCHHAMLSTVTQHQHPLDTFMIHSIPFHQPHLYMSASKPTYNDPKLNMS